MIKLERESWRTKDGKLTTGTRYFLTSLSRERIGDGRALLALIRQHWGVENANHWKRDSLWREDKTRLRQPRVVRLLALLRGALLPLISGNALAFFHDCAKRPSIAIALLGDRRLPLK